MAKIYSKIYKLIDNNIDMIALILISPIVFLICYALPLLATFLSRDQPDKWVAFWLLQIAASWTLIPFFSLFFECEAQMLLKAVFALALFFLLNREKVLLFDYSGFANSLRSVISCRCGE